jgi:hypothetical protein
VQERASELRQREKSMRRVADIPEETCSSTGNGEASRLLRSAGFEGFYDSGAAPGARESGLTLFVHWSNNLDFNRFPEPPFCEQPFFAEPSQFHFVCCESLFSDRKSDTQKVLSKANREEQKSVILLPLWNPRKDKYPRPQTVRVLLEL